MASTSSSGFSRAVIEVCHSMAHDIFGTYHPERHYMRGPGPKCRERQRAEAAKRELTHTEATPALA